MYNTISNEEEILNETHSLHTFMYAFKELNDRFFDEFEIDFSVIEILEHQQFRN